MNTDSSEMNTASFDGTQWSNAAVDVIEIVEPDPQWPARFAIEVQAIRDCLGPAADEFQFEHIGSTAVPNLPAKPIIDILLIPCQGWPREILERRLPSLDYIFWAENPDPQHLFFVKGMPPFGSGRTHHVHVRPIERAAPVLKFRDYLRTNPPVAAEYAELKKHLSAHHPNDRDAYTHGKDDFIASTCKP